MHVAARWCRHGHVLHGVPSRSLRRGVTSRRVHSPRCVAVAIRRSALHGTFATEQRDRVVTFPVTSDSLCLSRAFSSSSPRVQVLRRGDALRERNSVLPPGRTARRSGFPSPWNRRRFTPLRAACGPHAQHNVLPRTPVRHPLAPPRDERRLVRERSLLAIRPHPLRRSCDTRGQHRLQLSCLQSVREPRRGPGRDQPARVVGCDGQRSDGHAYRGRRFTSCRGGRHFRIHSG